MLIEYKTVYSMEPKQKNIGSKNNFKKFFIKKETAV